MIPPTNYSAEVTNGRGAREIDPNIWAYTREFAERFDMPREWIADDLKGAAAVAFRVDPANPSCGWGGNPKSCQMHEEKCVIEIYVDEGSTPLPWDARARMAEVDYRRMSLWFLRFARQFARPRGEMNEMRRGPFSEPQTGRELLWHSKFDPSTRVFAGGEAMVFTYDRTLFADLSFVKLNLLMCAETTSLQLVVANRPKAEDRNVLHEVILPAEWRKKVRKLVEGANTREEAHFKGVFEEVKDRIRQPAN